MAQADDRRNKLIWEALERDNWKQALQLCTKRLKKGEKSDYLLALKARVLIDTPSLEQMEEGLVGLKSLVNKEPPVVDIEALTLIRQSLADYFAASNAADAADELWRNVTSLYERGIKAKPKDEALGRDWFYTAFRQRRWRSAQKAALGQQRLAPHESDFHFPAILCCHLLSTSPEEPESDRKLYGTLAYRMMAKAASEAGSESVATPFKPHKTIHTTQELLFLISVYRKQGYIDEALDILDSASLGVDSAVAKGDWSVVRVKLELLECLKRWQESWDFCRTILEKARPKPVDQSNGTARTPLPEAYGDDWRFWVALIDASQAIGTDGSQEATKGLVQSYLDTPKPSRNARLAWLKFLSGAKGAPDQDSGKLAKACQDYFTVNATKSCVFDDLRCYLIEEYLSQSRREEFLKHTKQVADDLAPPEGADENRRISWVEAQINARKFELLLKISNQGAVAAAERRANLEAFVEHCIQLYKSALPLGTTLVETDNQAGDDTCLLAIIGLVDLSTMGPESDSAVQHSVHAFQATALLDHLLSRSKHNYQAMLIAVHLYLRLGAGSLAFAVYPRLSIKQIQDDTLSHNLLTRISTIHPHVITTAADEGVEEADLDPRLGLSRALKIYERCEDQIPDQTIGAFQKGSYDQVEGFLEFGSRVRNSICKYMWRLEQRRINRLLPLKAPTLKGVENKLLDPPSSGTRDNRDYNVLMSCEAPCQPRFEEAIQHGPRPKNEWVNAFTLSEQVLERLQSPPNEPLQSKQALHQDPVQLAQKLRDSVKSASAELTDTEKSYLELHIILADTLFTVATTQHDAAALTQMMFKVQHWLKQALETLQPLDLTTTTADLNIQPVIFKLHWTFFHESFLTLDALIAITSLLNYLQSLPKSGRQKLPAASELKPTTELLQLVYDQIGARASAHRNRLSESGVVGGLVDAAFGRDDTGEAQTAIGKAMEQIVDEGWMEMYMSKMVESWIEGLDGVLRVKIHRGGAQ